MVLDRHFRSFAYRRKRGLDLIVGSSAARPWFLRGSEHDENPCDEPENDSGGHSIEDVGFGHARAS